MKFLLFNFIIWTMFYGLILYRERKNDWIFVPCTTPSESRKIMSEYVKENIGTQYKLCVKGNTFGFEYK